MALPVCTHCMQYMSARTCKPALRWVVEGPRGKRCWWAVRLIEGRIHGE